MEKRNAFVLASIQKSNDFEIHECHAFEVQRAGRLRAIDLPLELIEVLRLQPTAQAYDRLVPLGSCFNP